jgi:hypothetical protein
MTEKLCQACDRGNHEDCSAQVLATNMPCECEHCWGTGGSKEVYNKIIDNSDRFSSKVNEMR